MAVAPSRAAAPAQSTALTVAGSSLPAWIAEVVQPYQGNKDFNLMLPALPINAEPGYGMRAALSVVQIDPDPNHQEIFKVGGRDGSDLFSIGKVGLNKMAAAAGIEYATKRVDDRSNPDRCEIEAYGTMRNHAGQSIRQMARKEFYMPDVEAESVAQRMKWLKPPDTEAKIREQVKREMAQFRKHLVARTETGAILRMVRSFLAVRQSWTKEEVSKPFVIMRMDFQPDTSDPVVRRAVVDSALNASRALYPVQRMDSRAEVLDEDPDFEPDGGEGDAAASDVRPGAVASGDSAAPLPQTAMPLGDEVTKARRAFFAEFNTCLREGRITVGGAVVTEMSEEVQLVYACGLLNRPVASRTTWTAQDWSRARVALPVAAPAGMVEAEPDYFAEISQGSEILGLTSAERNDMFKAHKGNLAAILSEINSRVDRKNEGAA